MKAVTVAIVALPFLVLILAMPALMIWALVDLVRRPTSEWDASGQDRLVWALIVVFVGLIGPILYLTVGRRKFDDLANLGFGGIVS